MVKSGGRSAGRSGGAKEQRRRGAEELESTGVTRKRKITLILILMSVGLSVVGQVSLKVGMNRIGAIDSASLARPLETLVRVFSTPLVWLGLGCYGIGALFWLVILSRLDLSYAYLALASMYVLIPLVSWLFLGERIPPMRWAGMVVVVLGVLIVAGS